MDNQCENNADKVFDYLSNKPILRAIAGAITNVGKGLKIGLPLLCLGLGLGYGIYLAKKHYEAHEIFEANTSNI